ncbi:MAG: helix-turn-helix domain-containing protein [Synergistaceae bacterium]|jgi:two-component system response regulator YesN|nr:helix-turn-helix domain-containing protein [Synergistaceae bacterium]
MTEPYRILIVEDEPLERRALEMTLASLVTEEPLEVRSVATAPDFESLAESWLPDVVLLDIRIPGGDGLTSLRALRGRGFSSHVVVLTAFDVFQYAQKAMGLGVTSFLVKPVSEGTFTETLQKVFQGVAEKRNHKAQFDEIRDFVERNRGAFAMGIIQDLLREKGVEASVVGIMASLGLPPARPCYLFGVVCLAEEEDRKGEQIFLWEAFERTLGPEVIVVPWRRSSALLFIPSGEAIAEPDFVASRLLGIISSRGFEANIVYGGRIRRLEELAPAVTQVEEGLEESLLSGTGRIVMRDVVSDEGVADPSPVLAQPGLLASQAQIVEGFSYGQPEQITRGSRALADVLNKIAFQDVELAKMLVLGLMGQICQVLLSLKCDSGSVRAWTRRQLLNLLAPNTPVGLNRIFSQALDQAWSVRGSASDTGSMIIEQSLAYIREHYEEVTLESVAEAVHVSPSYLSRLFRKVLKRRFVDEVKAIRIERAKSLLAQGHSVRDVAISVGYGNIAYFSTLFRQMTGRSPSEYRRDQE